ncbi:hypothetical protein P691DRAFT_790521 [Macrolepiota fuliginosa MF-IS2]|uniref:Uncharacterized protein n=1 Tax=Macrolepiota fuliginosa MF-IS2 TaxID=1400762 RepID=A0A9P6C5F5_9AGAR|nr:hypothetical protein P691DRAFT_790521 [Macrolepiota fuliginosa MF-IS2]
MSTASELVFRPNLTVPDRRFLSSTIPAHPGRDSPSAVAQRFVDALLVHTNLGSGLYQVTRIVTYKSPGDRHHEYLPIEVRSLNTPNDKQFLILKQDPSLVPNGHGRLTLSARFSPIWYLSFVERAHAKIFGGIKNPDFMDWAERAQLQRQQGDAVVSVVNLKFPPVGTSGLSLLSFILAAAVVSSHPKSRYYAGVGTNCYHFTNFVSRVSALLAGLDADGSRVQTCQDLELEGNQNYYRHVKEVGKWCDISLSSMSPEAVLVREVTDAAEAGADHVRAALVS